MKNGQDVGNIESLGQGFLTLELFMLSCFLRVQSVVPPGQCCGEGVQSLFSEST